MFLKRLSSVNIGILSRRQIHSTGSCYKNKRILKNLGISLQKGDISDDKLDDQRHHEHHDKQEEEMNKVNEIHKRVQEFYDSISMMTVDDLMIQQNLDQGKQFKSFPSEHYLDRKKIINSLPNEIDIFNTPLSQIERIYKELSKLDHDKSVHLKYYKRYLNNYFDPIIQLLQEFNGINEKFKLLRRNEIDNLSLNPNSYLYQENLFNLPYNVIGFDKSISGFPLRLGKHKVDDQSYPQEFIQDLQMFKKKIKVNKKDLDFFENNENTTNINPHHLMTPSEIMSLSDPSSGGDPKTNPAFNKIINLIYNELEVPKNFIIIKNINNFVQVNFNFLNKFNSIVETEINSLKNSLQKEIELILNENDKSNNLILFSPQLFKTNQFKLCDFMTDEENKNDTTKRATGSTTNSTPKPKPPGGNGNYLIINYNIKEFNMIPYNCLVSNYIKSDSQLYKQLFKIFLINLRDQLETLIRLKYFNNKSVFINNIHFKISNIIKYKLLKLFKSINLFSNKVDTSISFKPFDDKNFKRVYNYKSMTKLHRLDSTKRTSLRYKSKSRRTAYNFRLYDLQEISKDL